LNGQSLQYYTFIFDITNLFQLFIADVIFNIKAASAINGLQHPPALANVHADFQVAASIIATKQEILAVLVFICYARSLKLLQIPPYVGSVVQSIFDVSMLLR
jgi:hypothetical protein